VVAGGGEIIKTQKTFRGGLKMKKCAFALLIVLLCSTPSLAQMTTEGLITPERTLWEINGFPSSCNGQDYVGFYNGAVWIGCGNSFDFFPGSYYQRRLISHFGLDESIIGYTISLLGIGKISFCMSGYCDEYLLTKVSNNFSAESEY
jgi:hypothetical protein